MSLRFLNADQVGTALPMRDAIAGMREAFASLARGTARVPQRGLMELEGTGTALLTMPGGKADPARLGAKLLTLVPQNQERGLPTINGLYVAFDPDTGLPVGVLAGNALTAIRTGAASGLATDLLAREDAHRVAVIGAGVQAATQLEAVCCVRDVTAVRVYARNTVRAEAFIGRLDGAAWLPDDVACAATAGEAASGADIVCTATPATRPVLGLGDVERGAHINAIGSYTPAMRELAPALVHEAMIVVDERAAARVEAGELIAALDAGAVDLENVVELGEVVEGSRSGRDGPEQITLFKSVGHAVQDIVAAGLALDRAQSMQLGTVVEL